MIIKISITRYCTQKKSKRYTGEKNTTQRRRMKATHTHTLMKERDIDLEVFFFLDTFGNRRDLSKKKRILEERIVGRFFFQ
jgi:hypothetical protein